MSKPRRRKKLWPFLLIPALSIAVLGVWVYRVAKTIAPHQSLGGFVQGLRNPAYLFPGKDRVLILVAGKDYNHTPKDIAYTSGSRSDTIMLVSADIAHRKLSAVGIPRDTRVTAPDGVTGKINGAFQRGGIKLLSQTIEQQFGIRPDYGVVLKPDAVKSLVDALGGVEVDVSDRMFYEDSWDDLKIDLPAGHYRINGDQAVGFVRFRKTGTHTYDAKKNKITVPYKPSKEEGDQRRMARQQQLIRAMLTEVSRPATFLNLNHLLDVGFNQVDTNLTRTQMLALAQMFRGNVGAGLGGVSLPGKDGKVGKTYYWLADKRQSPLLLRWVLLSDEAAGKQLQQMKNS